ncbi:prepilin peptidase [Gallaecimonas xiamenensis]|uniref:Prepilin leader peptidase/N-methyltransferase n=1 Tax=Gallaecimonas xiamenensis 3-C-1 TaxID=745411 RepID=K2J9B4_9GAMM|nr:A24 family peptidase [Gallaecimonas xiamenensis]EKE71432.1 type IV prepilin peptidase PilD (type IV-A prepilin peptidase PilD) (leader peptidase PilD) [Gallaecimonas xiamenensis 3-C-1]
MLGREPLWLTVFVLVFGLLVGSFLNVVIYRLPVMLERRWQRESRELLALEPLADQPSFNLMVPRSHCPKCRAEVAWYDNVPLLSWLWLGGRCRHCKTPISARYPLVELATGLISAVVAWYMGPSVMLPAALLFTWVLVALTFIDADTMLLPDDLTLPLMWAGLLLSLIGGLVSPVQAILGAAIGYLSLWSVYWAFKLLTGKEGMGYGDFKLLAALGAWLGPWMLPQIILLSSVFGVIWGLYAAARRRQGSMPMPFGPFLAAAGWVALIWGQDINAWYLGYFQ